MNAFFIPHPDPPEDEKGAFKDAVISTKKDNIKRPKPAPEASDAKRVKRDE